MAQFTFKFTKTAIETTPNDVLITIESFLTDSNGFAFLDQFNALDVFDVSLVKSSLPASGYVSYLSILANKAINEKYNQTTIAGTAVSGNNVITNIDTSNLVPGLFVTGDNIPVDTTLVTIRDATSIRISNPPTITGSITINFSANGWDINYDEITRITQIVDLANL